MKNTKRSIFTIYLFLIDFSLCIFNIIYHFIKNKFYKHPLGIIFIISIFTLFGLIFIVNEFGYEYQHILFFLLSLLLLLLFVFSIVIVVISYIVSKARILIIEYILLYILYIIIILSESND